MVSHPNPTIAKWYNEALARTKRSEAEKGRMVLLVEVIDTLKKPISAEECGRMGKKLAKLARLTELHQDFNESLLSKAAALHRMASFSLAEAGLYSDARIEYGQSLNADRISRPIRRAGLDDKSLRKILRKEGSNEEVATDGLMGEAFSAFLARDPNRKQLSTDPIKDLLERPTAALEVLFNMDSRRFLSNLVRKDAWIEVATGVGSLLISAAGATEATLMNGQVDLGDVLSSGVKAILGVASTALIIYGVAKVGGGIFQLNSKDARPEIRVANYNNVLRK